MFLQKRNTSQRERKKETETVIFRKSNRHKIRRLLPWLRGFVGAYLPAVPGSNSKRIIYALPVYSQILYYICHCVEKKAESIHKEARFGQY